MKHLSGLDSTFLFVETAETQMHVGGLKLFAVRAGYSVDFYEDVKAHVASRMHLAPVFTRKPALMPFESASPAWIADDTIDGRAGARSADQEAACGDEGCRDAAPGLMCTMRLA